MSDFVIKKKKMMALYKFSSLAFIAKEGKNELSFKNRYINSFLEYTFQEGSGRRRAAAAGCPADF